MATPKRRPPRESSRSRTHRFRKSQADRATWARPAAGPTERRFHRAQTDRAGRPSAEPTEKRFRPAQTDRAGRPADKPTEKGCRLSHTDRSHCRFHEQTGYAAATTEERFRRTRTDG